MSFQRELWFGQFSRNSVPHYRCPRCDVGRLAAASDSLTVVETEYSKKARDNEDWEPDWEVERFSLRLTCTNTVCGEHSFVIGETTLEETHDGEFGWVLESVLQPRGFFPAPPIIEIPQHTPADVLEQIKRSFELFWSDLNSCANRLRVSIEFLLDMLKVSRTGKDKKDQPTVLDLNGRIALFAKIEPEHADTLTALRMIGNLGSHGDDVSREALLDAYEIYEEALADLCGHKKTRMAALRTKLISSKGKY
jgi:hypothetical protein